MQEIRKQIGFLLLFYYTSIHKDNSLFVGYVKEIFTKNEKNISYGTHACAKLFSFFSFKLNLENTHTHNFIIERISFYFYCEILTNFKQKINIIT